MDIIQQWVGKVKEENSDFRQTPMAENGLKESWMQNEIVVTQWCDPLTLPPEQSGDVGSITSRALPLECHQKRLRA